eukprot:jgi/Chlat1/7538/Chrsp62S07032
MRLVSYNVASWPPLSKELCFRFGSLDGFFEDYLQADIVCLQEVKLQEENLDRALACVPGYESFWAFSQVKRGYSGVTTYVKDKYSPVDARVDCLDSEDEELQNEGRLVLTDHGTFVLINCYVPNAGPAPTRPRLRQKTAFLRALHEMALRLEGEGRNIVIAGDLNVAHRQVDLHPGFHLEAIYCEEELQAMNMLCTDFVDCFRRFHPDKVDAYTVWDQRKNYRLSNRGLRLDYFLCSKNLVENVTACDIMDTSARWSDHVAITLDLRPQQAPPPHSPAALSSRRMKRFQATSAQQCIAAMFGGAARKGSPTTGRKKRPADAGNGEDTLEPTAASEMMKRPKTESDVACDGKEQSAHIASSDVRSHEQQEVDKEVLKAEESFLEAASADNQGALETSPAPAHTSGPGSKQYKSASKQLNLQAFFKSVDKGA